jgi:deoxyribodipyrimidine photo-lyase
MTNKSDTKKNSEQAGYGFHWFRRDLRVAGNPALQWSFKQHHGRVVGLFCFDAKFLSRPDFSANRFQFFLKTLESLRNELRSLGSDLLVMDTGPDEAFTELFIRLKENGQRLPQSVSWNRDYEPFARERDQRIQTMLQKHGISSQTERDHVLIEPTEIAKESAPLSPYQVYSPYSKSWIKSFGTKEVMNRIDTQKKGLQYLQELHDGQIKPFFRLTWLDLLGSNLKRDLVFDTYLAQNGRLVTVPIPQAGSLQALAHLKAFAPLTRDYGNSRDFPAKRGTSRLSPFLKNGSITVSQIIAALNFSGGEEKESGERKYLGELIWREFYYYILYHFPRVEHEAFQLKFAQIKWPNRDDWFEAWKDGRTGFPIVDAGMRELKTTGWMHNRVRMIVASFLTKDLLIDWKWGEQYFMNQLLDGDLAPNNGGWQWAASTGCDAQPYFRIFNPLLQSQKFDPDGSYIRQYVPELSGLNAKDIHNPPVNIRKSRYFMPIVDHSEQRAKALALYKVTQ